MTTRRIALFAPLAAFVLGWAVTAVAPADDSPGLPEAPLPYDAAKTAAERVVNEAAYREHILGWREYLLHRHLGDWVAIAGGKAYPVNRTGTAVCPAEKMEDAVAAASAAVPNARHRFVFRIGEEGDFAQVLGAAEDPHVLGNVFIAELERVDVEMKGFGPGQKIYYVAGHVHDEGPVRRRDEERIQITAKGPDDRMYMSPEVSTPGSPGRAQVLLLLSTGYGGCLTMSAETAEAVSLHLWEVPGAVTVEGALQKGTCRRARARVRFPGTELDFLLPVAVWPEKK